MPAIGVQTPKIRAKTVSFVVSGAMIRTFLILVCAVFSMIPTALAGGKNGSAWVSLPGTICGKATNAPRRSNKKRPVGPALLHSIFLLPVGLADFIDGR